MGLVFSFNMSVNSSGNYRYLLGDPENSESFHYIEFPVVQFDLKLKYDRQKLGFRTKTEEPWRVGLVQNVIFEKLIIAYQGKTFAKPWQNPLLDCIDCSASRPFVAPPRDIGYKNLWSYKVNTFVDILIGPNGFRDPSNKKVLSGPIYLTYADRPWSNVRDRHKGLLKRFEQITVFQVWLLGVKQGASDFVTIGVSERFTIVACVIYKTRRSDNVFGEPDGLLYPHYLNGDKRTLQFNQEVIKKLSQEKFRPTTRMKAANAPSPVVTGETANMVGKEWIQGNGLGVRSAPTILN